jgi:hypothetical protein
MKMTTSSVAGLVTIGLLLIGIETALTKGSGGGYFAKANRGGLQSSSTYQQLETTPANQAWESHSAGTKYNAQLRQTLERVPQTKTLAS